MLRSSVISAVTVHTRSAGGEDADFIVLCGVFKALRIKTNPHFLAEAVVHRDLHRAFCAYRFPKQMKVRDIGVAFKRVAVRIFVVNSVILLRKQGLYAVQVGKSDMEQTDARVLRDSLQPALLQRRKRHCGRVTQHRGQVPMQKLPFAGFERRHNRRHALRKGSLAHQPLQLALGDAALHGAFQNLGYRIVIHGIQFAEYYSFSPPPMPYRSYIACKSALNVFSAVLLEKRIEVILDRKLLIQGSISFVSKTSAEKR